MRNYKTFFLLIILAAFISGCKSEMGKPSEAEAVAPEILSISEAVKIKISQEGFYRLPLADLGWDAAVAHNLAITYRDQPIPILVETDGDGIAIIFYAQASDSPYTPENIYILEQNPDLALPIPEKQLPQPDGSSVDYFISTVHAEENHLYTPKVDQGSPWHWSKIVAPQSQSVDVELPNAADGSGNLRVALWGITSAPTTPDHLIRVSINGQNVTETEWDGSAWHILDVPIPAGILVDGKNSVEIRATGEGEARIDIVNLDWIEIDYAKKADQLEGQEFFRSPDKALQLAGSEGSLTIFEISSPSEISQLAFPDGPTDHPILQAEFGQRYLVSSKDGYLHPGQILPLAATPDLRTNPGAAYLAIGHPDLLAPLEPLMEARNQQGLSTLAVPVESIYDQFNGGMAEPQAIQTFLRHAVENWKTPPEYVLLVGDTSYDTYGYQTPLDPLNLPTFLVQSVFGGETGSDVLIAQINADEWPDLAIGRVPAQTVDQVQIFVDKTLAFEQAIPIADWNQSILAVADGQEASFQIDAERFIEQFPTEYQTQLIAPEAGAEGTNQQITSELEAGQLLTAYFGHGSVNMWGKDSLFTTEDAGSLGNEDRLPVVLNFTCLTGLFTHPTEESLAESLLFNPQGGAVAVLAPTSPTLPNDQTFLSDAFIEAMVQNPTPRLGQITLHAWRSVPTQSPGSIDVMQTFLLFGDPALQMPSP